MPIQGVAFDMDGLMFDTEALAIESWIHAGREFGLRLDREIVLLTLGVIGKGPNGSFRNITAARWITPRCGKTDCIT